MIKSAVAEYFIPFSQNLKEKRMILRRALTRTRKKFNVSISETGFKDKWQRSEITLVLCSDTERQADKELREVLAFLDSFPEWERGKTFIHTL